MEQKKKILVMSVGELQEFLEADNYAIISFYDAGENNIQEEQDLAIAANTALVNHSNILFIEANDIEKTWAWSWTNYWEKGNIPVKLFDKEQAKRIIHFVRKNQDKDFIIQCVHGHSRSLSTAIFLEETLLKDTHQLINNERVIRNRYIYKTLLKALK